MLNTWTLKPRSHCPKIALTHESRTKYESYAIQSDLRISSFFSDVEPPKWSAEVRRIGTLLDSRFWAAQKSASRKSLDSIALFCAFFA